MSILQKIGESFDSDKAKNLTSGITYLEYYENIFKDLKNIKTILEIGTYYGNGLLTLSEYFNDSQVVSIDKKVIEVVHDRIDGKDNCFVYECDQTDKNKLLQIVSKHCEYIDVVIDDASHEIDKTIETFKILYPKLKNGGYYIIEDLQCMVGSTKNNVTYDNDVNVEYKEEDYPKLVNFISYACQYILKTGTISEVRVTGNILVIKK